MESKVKFQSTHPHGVRLGRNSNRRNSSLFQSTHPHGVRRYYGLELEIDDGVSIHAPARGAT